MIPLPFSFAVACVAVAVFTSKLQYQPTHLLLALHSISSPLCLAATCCILPETTVNTTNLLIWIAVGLFGGLNLLGTIAQTCFFMGDGNFIRWIRAGSQKPKFSIYGIWLIFVTIIASLGGFQFQNIIFCRLFNFSCFKAQLKTIKTFRVCHLLNFLAYVPQIIIVYTVATSLQSISTNSLKMVFIDSLITTTINMLLALFVSRKEDDFFSEVEDGIHINKVACLNDDDNTLVYMQESQNKIKSLPDILEFDEFGYCTTKRNRERKRSMKKISAQSIAAMNYEERSEQQEQSKKEKIQSVQENTQTDMQIRQNQVQENVQIINDPCRQGINVGSYDEGLGNKQSQQGSKAVGKANTADVASQTIRQAKPPNIMIIQEDYIEESQLSSEKQEQIFQNHSIVKQEPLVFSGLQGKTQANKIEQSQIQHQKQIISEQYCSENSSIVDQQKKESGFKRSKTITHKTKKPFEFFINKQALIQSESSFTNTEVIRKQLQHQQLVNQEQAKALFKRTTLKHRSPPKTIKKDDRQQLVFHKRNPIYVKINEPNAQMPIKQRNIRGKSVSNHPMNEYQSHYPLNKIKVSEQYSCNDDDESNRQAKRQTLKTHKSVIEHHKYVQISELSHQKQHKNLDNFALQPDLLKAQASDFKKFTRSNFKSMICLFTQMKKNDARQSEIMTIDKPPQQPTRDSTSSISGGQYLGSIFRRNGVRSAPKGRVRPQTSKEKEVGRRFNQDRKPGVGQQSKKMNSLQKIYLQRLSNF